MEDNCLYVIKYLKQCTFRITQAIKYCTLFFIQLVAIVCLAALVEYVVTAVLHRQTKWFRLAHTSTLYDFSSGFTIHRDTCEKDGTSLVGKFFYTLVEGDDVTSEEVCCVENTLRSNPNTTCYIMIFTSPTTNILEHMSKKMKEIYTLIEKYDNAIILNLDGENHFRGTPLYDFWKRFKRNSTLIQFAARVLTTWQFGGTTYDSHLFTLQNNSISALPDLLDTVAMDLNHGFIMSAHQQCHAFLFNLVKVLAIIGQGEIIETFEREVLSLALVNFCEEVQATSKNGSMTLELACAGVTGLPPGLLCYTNQSDPGCTWGYLRLNASESAVYCPVTAMGVHDVTNVIMNSSYSHHMREILDDF